MSFFEGAKCPVCGKIFNEKDDVVACPQCGTPHHRDCYIENGGCAFEDSHGEGFVWQPEQKPEDSSGEESLLCPACGAENPHGRLFCESCGKQLFERRFESGESENQTTGGSWQAGGGSASFGSEAQIISDGELIEDVPVGDIKRFVGSSSFYYIPQFVVLARYCRKISVNFFAFFAHGLWFISRKMYALGGILLAVQLAVLSFQTYCAVQFAPFAEYYMSNDYNAATEQLTKLFEDKPLLIFGFFISLLVHYGIIFFSGLFGNKVYMSYCIGKIKELNRTSKNAEQFNSRLEERGGSSLALAIGCGVLYVTLRMILQTKLGV